MNSLFIIVAIIALISVIFLNLRNIAKENRRIIELYKLWEHNDNIVYILPNGTLLCRSLFLEYCQTYGDLAMCFNEEIRDKYQEECLSIGINVRPYVSKARDLDLWERIVLIGS